ncbi:MAG: OB-fold nucleic acid binding domain-containing protein, partial [Pirellulales bacterium]
LSGDITGRNFKKKDALVEHVEDCRRMGIDVAPPDVNASGPDFTVAGDRILFGLAAIKGCGLQAAEAIRMDRERNGVYHDLDDFCGRLDPAVVNRTAIESLVKAGALDRLGAHRGALLAGIERAMAAGAARLADRRSGQKSLFESLETPAAATPAVVRGAGPDVPPLTDAQMRIGEKEVLGYYVHSHPLAEHAGVLEAVATHGTTGLAGVPARGEVVIGGLVAALKLSSVKQPRPGSTHTRYCMFDLEDMEGLVRTICWPEDYARLGELIQTDAVVVVSGAIDRRAGSDETNLIVNDIVPVAAVWNRPVKGVTIKVTEPGHGPGTLDLLAAIVRRHPGTVPMRLVIELVDGRRVLMDADRHAVAWSESLHGELLDLLGPGAIRAAMVIPRRGDGDGGRRSGAGRAPARSA